jgi:hypothetical protein
VPLLPEARAVSSGTTADASPAAPVERDPDQSPLQIGVLYVNGGNTAIASAFADTPVSFGDGRLEAQAVVDDINANGGVRGRMLEAHYAPVEAANANGPGLQAACESLVHDHDVFAIMSIFNVRSLLAACAAKYEKILFSSALGGGDDDLYAEFRDWVFTPTQLSLDREQRTVLHVGRESGRITAGSKVGVVIQDDDPQYNRVYEGTIAPILDGWDVDHFPAHIASAGSTGDISGAVLRFKAEGVTSVLFSAGNGGIPVVFFMQTAEQQAYHPRYELGDSSNTWFVGSQAPIAQRRNIHGAGTYPIANVHASQYPTTPREQHCLDVISDAGEPVDDRHTSLTATFYCEIIYGFAAVGNRVTGPMTPASWRTAYYGFGTDYPAITTFASDLSTGRNDNPALYRVLGFLEDCACITYLSDRRPLEL